MHAWIEPGAPRAASSSPAPVPPPHASPAAATAPAGTVTRATHELLARAGPGHGGPTRPDPRVQPRVTLAPSTMPGSCSGHPGAHHEEIPMPNHSSGH